MSIITMVASVHFTGTHESLEELSTLAKNNFAQVEFYDPAKTWGDGSLIHHHEEIMQFFIGNWIVLTEGERHADPWNSTFTVYTDDEYRAEFI